jgi:predicted kinase
VYRALLDRAADALRHGRPVVADATWPTRELREEAAAIAGASASRLVALECRLPLAQAAARAQRRHDGGRDLSEADAAVARRLAAAREPWPDAVGIDTRTSPEQALARALTAVEGPFPSTVGTKAPAWAGL